MNPEELEKLWNDEQHWTWLHYRCASDPRPIVPKRGCIGWTPNVGHPHWIAYSIFIGILILIPPVIAMALIFLIENQVNILISILLMYLAIGVSILACAFVCRRISDSKKYN